MVLVLTHLNAPKLTPPPTRMNPMDLSTMAAGSSIAFLNTDEVHVDGQPVAAVVAETLEAAQYAASLVRVDYLKRHAHGGLRRRAGQRQAGPVDAGHAANWRQAR